MSQNNFNTHSAIQSSSPYRFEVQKISDNLPRPVWSVMIPAYNCFKYLTQTISGVLNQDPGPEQMQIEVVDDCSTDGHLEKLIKQIGHGRISYYRQKRNVGHIRNFETCLSRSRGILIHLLHGDDYVKPGFYDKIQKAFVADDKIGAAFTRQMFINENGYELDISPLEQDKSGRLNDHLEVLSIEQKIMTPSIVVRRDVYEKLGGFDNRLLCSEDWEMWVRIASQYPIWYETEPLAVYRMHNLSNTGRHIRTAEDIRYTRLAINIFKEYLPTDKAEYITRKALFAYSKSAINTAMLMLRKKDMDAMRSQLREAFKCSNSISVYSYLINKFIKSITS